MAAFADLERFLERVFERTAARLFRSRVQAVQVERRVERAMEAGRTGRGTATAVPNRYRVRMHPSDLDDLAARSGSPEALAAGLADGALAFARLHSYHLVSRPTVSVVADPSAERGMVEVDASVWRPDPAAPASPPREPGPGTPDMPGDAAPAAPLSGVVVVQEASDDLAALLAPARLAAEDDAASAVPVARPEAGVRREADMVLPRAPNGAPPDLAPLPDEASARSAVSAAPPSARPADPLHSGGIRASGDRPYAVRPAVPPPARALLRVSGLGGREREVRVESEPLTLGRSPDNGLVIADARVSRHHGRFVNRHGTLVYTDLGSTNGTRVNGIRVDEIVLGAGDRLQVGDVVVVVEQLPR